MIRAARRCALAILLAAVCFAAAAPPVIADPGGRWGGCIQLCNLMRELCVENLFHYCAEFYRGQGEHGICISQFLPTCNRQAIDCQYTYCRGGDPDPLRVHSRRDEEAELPRAVE